MLDLKKFRNNNGFALMELLVAIFIASLIVALLLPNLVNEYKYMKKAEDEMKMRTILYEELLANKEDVSMVRDGYDIVISKNSARIRDINSGKEINYEK